MYEYIIEMSIIFYGNIVIFKNICYEFVMETRKNYTTTLRQDLIRSLKMLAVKNDVRANDLLEEAIQDLLEKYEKKDNK